VEENKPDAKQRIDGAPTDFVDETATTERATAVESDDSERDVLSEEQVAMAGCVPG